MNPMRSVWLARTEWNGNGTVQLLANNSDPFFLPRHKS